MSSSVRTVFTCTVLISNIYVHAVITTLSDLDTEFANFVDEYFDKQSIVPIQTIGGTIAVTVDFDLLSVIELKDDTSHVTLAGYLTVVWTEGRYTTVSDDIDVGVLTSAIWTPPISIVNSLSSTALIGSDDDVAKFNLNTARVVWKPWIHTTVACDSNSFFPFDKQECSLKISSLTLDNTEMTLTPADNTLGTASAEENRSWKLKTTSVTSYTVDSSPYVVYKITLKRRSQFLMFIVACPLFVMTIMHLFIFLIPQEKGQRTNYCVTSMTGVLITLLWAMTYIPIGATPLPIVMFYLFTGFLLDVFVVIAALVLSDKFSGFESCNNGTCCEDLVTNKKAEKVSSLDDSRLGPVSNVTDNTATSPTAVRVASVTTAWDDDDFNGNPNTQETSDVNQTDSKVKSNKKQPVFTFVFFLIIHICFTIAFFVPLGLNAE